MCVAADTAQGELTIRCRQGFIRVLASAAQASSAAGIVVGHIKTQHDNGGRFILLWKRAGSIVMGTGTDVRRRPIVKVGFGSL